MKRRKQPAPVEVDPDELLLQETQEDIEEGGGVELRSGPAPTPPPQIPVQPPSGGAHVDVCVSALVPSLDLLIEKALEAAVEVERRSFTNPKLSRVIERLTEAQMWSRRAWS